MSASASWTSSRGSDAARATTKPRLRPLSTHERMRSRLFAKPKRSTSTSSRSRAAGGQTAYFSQYGKQAQRQQNLEPLQVTASVPGPPPSLPQSPGAALAQHYVHATATAPHGPGGWLQEQERLREQRRRQARKQRAAESSNHAPTSRVAHRLTASSPLAHALLPSHSQRDGIKPQRRSRAERSDSHALPEAGHPVAERIRKALAAAETSTSPTPKHMPRAASMRTSRDRHRAARTEYDMHGRRILVTDEETDTRKPNVPVVAIAPAPTRTRLATNQEHTPSPVRAPWEDGMQTKPPSLELDQRSVRSRGLKGDEAAKALASQLTRSAARNVARRMLQRDPVQGHRPKPTTTTATSSRTPQPTPAAKSTARLQNTPSLVAIGPPPGLRTRRHRSPRAGHDVDNDDVVQRVNAAAEAALRALESQPAERRERRGPNRSTQSVAKAPQSVPPEPQHHMHMPPATDSRIGLVSPTDELNAETGTPDSPLPAPVQFQNLPSAARSALPQRGRSHSHASSPAAPPGVRKPRHSGVKPGNTRSLNRHADEPTAAAPNTAQKPTTPASDGRPGSVGSSSAPSAHQWATQGSLTLPTQVGGAEQGLPTSGLDLASSPPLQPRFSDHLPEPSSPEWQQLEQQRSLELLEAADALAAARQGDEVLQPLPASATDSTSRQPDKQPWDSQETTRAMLAKSWRESRSSSTTDEDDMMTGGASMRLVEW